MTVRWITNQFDAICTGCGKECNKGHLVEHNDFERNIKCMECSTLPIPILETDVLKDEVINRFLLKDEKNAKIKLDKLKEYERNISQTRGFHQEPRISPQKGFENIIKYSQEIVDSLINDEMLKKYSEKPFDYYHKKYKEEFFRLFRNIAGDDYVDTFLKQPKNKLLSFYKEIANISKNTYKIQRPEDSVVIDPTTPILNRKALWDTLNNCKEFIYWYDGYFEDVGLEFLLNGLADNPNVKEIKLMTDLFVDHKRKNYIPSRNLHRIFMAVQQELDKEYDINIQMKIITQRDLAKSWHGRIIITKHSTWILPSVKNIQIGSHDKIKRDEDNLEKEKTHFLNSWNNEASLDLVNDWDKIEQIMS